MDRAASRGPRPGPPGSLLHGSCNYLQNVVAISYIFGLQLPTFSLCNIHIIAGDRTYSMIQHGDIDYRIR